MQSIVTSPASSSQSNFRKRKQAFLQHVERQQPQKQMKSAVHTPVILSLVQNNRYDDLHYDPRQVSNLCIPYNPNIKSNTSNSSGNILRKEQHSFIGT